MVYWLDYYGHVIFICSSQLACVNVILETPYEIDSYVRGFHAYKESWNLGLTPCSETLSGGLLHKSFKKYLGALLSPFFISISALFTLFLLLCNDCMDLVFYQSGIQPLCNGPLTQFDVQIG